MIGSEAALALLRFFFSAVIGVRVTRGVPTGTRSSILSLPGAPRQAGVRLCRFGLAPGGARRKLGPASAVTRLNGGASRSLADIKTICIISQYCRRRLRPGLTRISPFRAGQIGRAHV